MTAEHTPSIKRNLHELCHHMGIDFDEAKAALCVLYENLDAHISTRGRAYELPCGAGCDGCCHTAVFVTPLEFLYMWDWAQENLEDSVLEGIVSEGLRLYEYEKETIEAFAKPPPEGEADHFSIARHLSFRCPMLGHDGLCLVYPAREADARLFGASLFKENEVYGCELSANALEGELVTLPNARAWAHRVKSLPLTFKRQVYPWYFNWLYRR